MYIFFNSTKIRLIVSIKIVLLNVKLNHSLEKKRVVFNLAAIFIFIFFSHKIFLVSLVHNLFLQVENQCYENCF